MKEIAPNVHQFQFLWPNAFNAYYLQGDGESIVVDASTRWDWGFMRRQLQGRPVTAMLLTHAHPDHQGCANNICKSRNAPFLVHEEDADSAEGKAPLVRQNPAWEIIGNIIWAGKRTPVSRRLKEGDRIAGFTIHHMPGHTPGQIILFRESDRVAIVGDVINTNDYLTGLFTLVREPPRTFSLNPRQNRDSIRKLAALNPSLVCAGHGPPLRNMKKLERFVERLAP